MKASRRILMPDGTWKSFPEKLEDKAVKLGKKDPIVKEEIKEEIKLPQRRKAKANREAKKENEKLAKVEEKKANEVRISGN